MLSQKGQQVIHYDIEFKKQVQEYDKRIKELLRLRMEKLKNICQDTYRTRNTNIGSTLSGDYGNLESIDNMLKVNSKLRYELMQKYLDL